MSLYAQPWEDLDKLHSNLELGGRWTPRHCRPRHRVAIIIPYRDRDAHLRILLNQLHPFLQKQLLEYRVYVSEQVRTCVMYGDLDKLILF